MKKYLVLVCLFGLAGPSLNALIVGMIGESAAYVSQDFAAGTPWGATSLGLMGNAYVDVAGRLGVYLAVSAGGIASSTGTGGTLDLGQYAAESFNSLLGFGFRTSLGNALTALIAGGAYYGEDAALFSGSDFAYYLAGGIGVGMGATLLFHLFTPHLGIGANVNIAYGFYNAGNSVEFPVMAPDRLAVFGGIGVFYSL